MKQLTGYALWAFVFIFFPGENSIAQNPENPAPTTPELQSLESEIIHMDSVLFDAFNSRDLETIKTLFTTDLEFYHDKGGLGNYEQNMDALKSMFEGQRKVRRELVAGSTSIYPVPNYGAIQTGEHRFYNTEPGQAEQLGGTFKFLHIWINENGAWKISRVVSYDH